MKIPSRVSKFKEYQLARKIAQVSKDEDNSEGCIKIDDCENSGIGACA